MKKTTITLSLILITLLSIQAQNKSFDLWFNAGFGPRLLDTDPGLITTFYVDDSPSRDHLQSEVEIKDEYKRTGLNVELGYAHAFNLSHAFTVDAAFGKAGSFLFGYSVGYNKKIKLGKESKLVIRPAISAIIGRGNFKLGEIQNNAAYIQIANQRYFDDYLIVSIIQNNYIFGPKLNVSYIFPNEIGINCSLAYDFNFSAQPTPDVYFRSTNPPPSNSKNAPNNGSSIVSLDSDNISIDFNGNEIKQLPYKYGGFRISFAFSLYGEY